MHVPHSLLWFLLCMCVCVSTFSPWGWNIWVLLVCWVLCHFEFIHLISQLLRDQNQLHFGSVLPASARLTALRRREMDSIRVAVLQEDQFNSCQEYFVWLNSAFNTVGKLSSIVRSAARGLLFYCWKLINDFFYLTGKDQASNSKGNGSPQVRHC